MTMTPDGSIKWPVRIVWQDAGEKCPILIDAANSYVDDDDVEALLNSIPAKDAEIAGLRERVKEQHFWLGQLLSACEQVRSVEMDISTTDMEMKVARARQLIVSMVASVVVAKEPS